jgi:hypothetical protein
MDHVDVHVHLRLLVASWLMLTACGNDIVVVPELEPGERACAFPMSVGHWDDGTLRHIGSDRTVCVCMTEAEFESKSRFDDLNDALLADCHREAAKYDFDWTECEADYESKIWLNGLGIVDGSAVWWPMDDTDHPLHPPGIFLECSGDV